MILSTTAQAILLLTCHFDRAEQKADKPLTNSEWGRFALWLKDTGSTPADLLGEFVKDILQNWRDTNISTERLLALLGRGHSLGVAIEKWSRSGLWILTRSDAAYPKRLKMRLKTDAPPVLFGCGNASLLNDGGVAVIGSRDAGNEDLIFTERLGHQAAHTGYCIVSGGARGVDETAMQSALQVHGNVIGVLADSLLRAATSSKWRNGLTQGNLVLVSPFSPEASFFAGNAMARNKYIYCLADAAVVVHSSQKGGTWSGAVENLKKKWVPLWVKPTNDFEAGNRELVRAGGQWCETNIEALNIATLRLDSLNIQAFHEYDSPEAEVQDDIFSLPESQFDLLSPVKTPLNSNCNDLNISIGVENSELHIAKKKAAYISVDFYKTFLSEMERFLSLSKNLDEIIEETKLTKSQVSEWLKIAVDEGCIEKLSKPVRYRWKI